MLFWPSLVYVVLIRLVSDPVIQNGLLGLHVCFKSVETFRIHFVRMYDRSLTCLICGGLHIASRKTWRIHYITFPYKCF